MELSEVKNYLKVDLDDDDSLISMMITAAEHYLINAGVTIDNTDPLVKVALLALICDWYENRSTFSESIHAKEVGISINMIITQLKYSQGVI